MLAARRGVVRVAWGSDAMEAVRTEPTEGTPGARGGASPTPFAAFDPGAPALTPARAAITAARRRSESACLPALIAAAEPGVGERVAAERLARQLVETLRGKGPRGGVDALVREYDLTTREGVALMCLAEALLRIPDPATRDALIRDRIGGGDWGAHLGRSPSLFVNAATWGLVVTGRLAAPADEAGLGAALTRLIARGGEPLIRAGVDRAVRMMGERFVTGETIAGALAASRRREAEGFRHSFDMLGEAAMTAADSDRYAGDYETAIHAIGRAAAGRGPYEGPGISIKLSALHPRYARSQRDRVMGELLPRVAALAALARRHDIGLNIDAEEADRLDLSLDILDALSRDPRLAGWDGLGFVVQAYQTRASAVIACVVELARRDRRRLMVRLVKGAYWDAEIKRAQVDGLDAYPVFTRKLHTDVSYLTCARALLAAGDRVFPQFATHNAQTVAAVHAMAGHEAPRDRYEFQCLHGMGETLYEAVVGADGLDRPCRIYAPVGTHETLLAYLVRRLLENGANASFVNRIADPSVSIDALVADPVAAARRIAPLGAPHPAIALPAALFPDRRYAEGVDLADEAVLAALGRTLREAAVAPHRAVPMLAAGEGTGKARPVGNPADRRDAVGTVVEADARTVESALAAAAAGADAWTATPPRARAARLERAADLIEARRDGLVALVVREAGKTVADAVAELRESVDFLRYYAAGAAGFANDTHRPLGPVACISPWNFPLAIFTGQVAAALAAGNVVLAKPAEETPLIAGAAVRSLREAGVPPAALQLLPGGGTVGAALVSDPRVRAVLFTGSTDVAREIAGTLARRLDPDGAPVPLIAETGGLNALVVDSSALTEQVVADVLASAFGAAGQRCSALRLLCLQEEIADRTLAMLRGAMRELRIGNPDRLATDIGPVIGKAARDGILAHVASMRAAGRPVFQIPLPEACDNGCFVPPTLIELSAVADLTREVFGPVLHVVRFPRAARDAVLAAIDATGYGLTFGVHTRLDETVARASERVRAGNTCVNRSLVGAVVGVQPFGGRGLSGTGPKAGGPLLLRRLLAACPAGIGTAADPMSAAARAWCGWLRARDRGAEAAEVEAVAARTPWGGDAILPGPVGEENRYGLRPRGTVLCAAVTNAGLAAQVGAVLATGNRARVRAPAALRAVLSALPDALRDHVSVAGGDDLADVAAILWEGPAPDLTALAARVAARPGPIVPIHVPRRDPATGFRAYPAEWLLDERTVSVNTAAAGGNASLMAIG